MAYALNISSTDKSSNIIKGLWNECGALEDKPSMFSLEYLPHITLAIYETVDIDLLVDTFETAFAEVRNTTILFDQICTFESPDSLVLWAKPTIPQEILKLHTQIHDMIDAQLCREHYRPQHWVPHCSLATAIPLDKKPEAMDIASRKMTPFEVQFDIGDCVSFLPVQTIAQQKLM